MSGEKFSANGRHWSLFGHNNPGAHSSAGLGVNTNLGSHVNVGASTTFTHQGLQAPTVTSTFSYPTGTNSSVAFQGSTGPGGQVGSVNFTYRF